jgi:hypothetical protein
LRTFDLTLSALLGAWIVLAKVVPMRHGDFYIQAVGELVRFAVITFG